jgi:hypothetical protein
MQNAETRFKQGSNHDDGVPHHKFQKQSKNPCDANGVIESETEAALSSASMDLLICINMIHISPWSATVGLMKLAKRTMPPGGVLYCYGPYKVGGTAVESNL